MLASDGSLSRSNGLSLVRRLERRQDLIQWLKDNFEDHKIIDLMRYEDEGKFLEEDIELMIRLAAGTPVESVHRSSVIASRLTAQMYLAGHGQDEPPEGATCRTQ